MAASKIIVFKKIKDRLINFAFSFVDSNFALPKSRVKAIYINSQNNLAPTDSTQTHYHYINKTIVCSFSSISLPL